MKIFIRTYDEDTFTEKENLDLNNALLNKKETEKVHLCFHDEKPVKPCRLM